jgi:hypothetical protein
MPGRFLIAFLAWLVGVAWADPVIPEDQGYSLDFPPGWTVDKKASELSLSHLDGSSFIGLKAELPPDIESSKVAGMMLRAAALAAGFCGDKHTSEFELKGPGWIGHGFRCDNRPAARGAASQTIGLAAKHGEVFYHFMLFVPRQDWDTNSEAYLGMLRSLRFIERSIETRGEQ